MSKCRNLATWFSQTECKQAGVPDLPRSTCHPHSQTLPPRPKPHTLPKKLVPESNNLAHHVMAAKRIGHPHAALRILAPLAIDDKKIIVRPGGQIDGCRPDTTLLPLHRNGALLPIGKISHQQDLL